MAVDLESYRARVGAHDLHRTRWKDRDKGSRNGNMNCCLPILIPLWVLIIANMQPSLEVKLCNNVFLRRPIDLSKVKASVKYLAWFLVLVNIIALSNDIEANPGPITTKQGISFYFLNTQSVKTTDKVKQKLIEFKNMIYTLQPDVFAVNETWLIEQIPDSAVISTDYYLLHRKDRTNQIGGGVALLVKRDIWSKHRDELECPNIRSNEIIAVEIKPDHKRKIMVLCCYRSQAHKPAEFYLTLNRYWKTVH